MDRAIPPSATPVARARARRPRAALAAAFLVLAGCAFFREIGVGGDDPHWQVARFKGINQSQALTMAQTATAREYPTQKIDAFHGEFQTGWIYGTFDSLRRQPLRQRVVVEAKPEEGLVVVKLRVQQEQNPASGSFQPKPDDEGWEQYVDDDRKAVLMMQRLLILLKDVAEFVPEPKEGESAKS